ncbi:MAG: aromatic acid exporter family protein [Bacilli bacterium]|nr:aromatic acid exporter family protein [Bacilli bacterium]
MFKIGLRTLKTGLVVALSVILSAILKLEYPFFVVMTAIISMDKTMVNSLKMGRNRVFGTFLGACIGIGLSYIDRGNPLLCGLGIIILIQICNHLKLQGAITIGGIVMTAIMVHTDKTPLYYGFHRTLDTLVGATISFVVNMTVFPYSRLKTIDKTTSYFWIMLDHIINVVKEYRYIELDDFREELKYIENEIDLCHKELILTKKQKDSVKLLESHYDMAKKVFFELEVCQTVDIEKEKNIYDYHMNKAINIHQSYVKDFQF